jgi:hypothetical protein
MLRFGLSRLFAVLLFGIAIPFAIHRLSQLFGLWPVLAAAIAAGIAYGALKADNAWSGAGLADNLLLMATSALILVAYVALIFVAARAVARIRF